jgi:uncharacterized membrane protein (DUF485 family)
METLNRNHISYQEMNGLIELAEKVSINIEVLRSKIKKYQVQITIYFLFSILVVIMLLSGNLEFLYNKLFNGSSTSITSMNVSAVVLGGIYALIALKFQDINHNKPTINREQIVLQKLLNMIEGYKDLYVEDEYSNNSHVISKALFEMRLSRINFGVK